MGVGGQGHAPAALPPIGRPQGLSGRVRKIWPSIGIFLFSFTLYFIRIYLFVVFSCILPFISTYNTTQTSIPLAGFEPQQAIGRRTSPYTTRPLEPAEFDPCTAQLVASRYTD